MRWFLAVLVAAFVAAGLIVATQPINAAYGREAFNSTNQNVRSTATTPCITALDEFLGHYGSGYVGNTGDSLAITNYNAASAACDAAVPGRAHLAWVLIGLAGLSLLAIAVLVIRDSQRIKKPRRSPDPQ